MPVVAYVSMKRKRRGGVLTDVFSPVKVTIKDESEILAIAARKDFVRWRVGNMTLEEVIARRKQEGKATWYV